MRMYLTLWAAVLIHLSQWSSPAVAAETRALTVESWSTLQASFKDKPTIVHVWGLSCAICMSELEDWGAFAARNRGVRLVFLNWDRQPNQARIAATLHKHGLTAAESFVRADTFEEKLRFAIDRDWMGEMPRTQLIAADAAPVIYSGATDFARLQAWIDSGRYEP